MEENEVEKYVSKFTGPQIDSNLTLAQTAVQAEVVSKATDII